MIGIGQITWTIHEFTKVFPEFDTYADGGTYNEPGAKNQKLYKLFHEQLSEQQIRWFRAQWHSWRVDHDLAAEAKIKEFINQYLKD